MTRAKVLRRKRLMRGRDWHAWAWQALRDWPRPGELFNWAEPERPINRYPTGKGTGHWVRVKFVIVRLPIKPKRGAR